MDSINLNHRESHSHKRIPVLHPRNQIFKLVRDIIQSEMSFKYEIDCAKLQTLATAGTVGFRDCDRPSSIILRSLD